MGNSRDAGTFAMGTEDSVLAVDVIVDSPAEEAAKGGDGEVRCGIRGLPLLWPWEIHMGLCDSKRLARAE